MSSRRNGFACRGVRTDSQRSGEAFHASVNGDLTERPPREAVGAYLFQWSLAMMNLRTLSATAALALILPLAIPSQSLAQRGARGPAPSAGASVGGGGGAAISPGGAGIAAGGGTFAGAGGRVAAGPGFTAGRVATGPGVGGGYYGGQWGHRHHGGFWPGVAVGAALGSYAYYGGPDYYDDYAYDTGPTVAVVPEGGDSVAYCQQRYRSYDPASGTYLGYDGLRHPCP